MWIIVAIAAYFLLAFVAVIDKYLLAGPLPNPKLYAFVIGIFGGLAFLLIPFGFFVIPPWPIIVFAMMAGVIQIFSLVALFSGLKNIEASRIVPAIGGLLPVFTLLFTISLGRAQLHGIDILAFVLLVGGSVVITLEKGKLLSFAGFLYAFVASLLFSIFVVLSKFVYEGVESFLSAFLLIIAGTFGGALLLLVSGELRGALWSMMQRRGVEKQMLSVRVLSLFAGNQILATVGFVLQNWAVALVPFAYIAFVNALEGVKYVFVLLLASAIALKFPHVLKEEIGKAAIIQKFFAIAFIGIGLFLLAL